MFWLIKSEDLDLVYLDPDKLTSAAFWLSVRGTELSLSGHFSPTASASCYHLQSSIQQLTGDPPSPVEFGTTVSPIYGGEH